jgi:acyl carrier protein phosphodiesterase
MNFLAHVFLSGNDQQSMIGNFIADSVKGKEVLTYSPEIQEGIKFHRFIDTYTDSHTTILEAKKIIAPYFGKYNAVVVDIYMDHFLAKDWNAYSNVPLEAFSKSVYSILSTNKSILPARLQEMLPYMLKQDWLSNYAYFHGMEQVFKGMSKRAAFVSHMEDATKVLKIHYIEFQKCFDDFFPDLMKAAEKYTLRDR